MDIIISLVIAVSFGTYIHWFIDTSSIKAQMGGKSGTTKDTMIELTNSKFINDDGIKCIRDFSLKQIQTGKLDYVDVLNSISDSKNNRNAT